MVHLGESDRSLHISDLEIEAGVGIDVFMIVTLRKAAELPAESLAAGIFFARVAPAVSTPVPEGFKGAL